MIRVYRRDCPRLDAGDVTCFGDHVDSVADVKLCLNVHTNYLWGFDVSEKPAGFHKRAGMITINR